ncbi:hypothetical protein K469DRAFT_722287 [Zopfia rhizophila CBS 207.26]|uniref:Uncharacterized protein n=1 Tax=Zopfia rhizophila CBS 207.26 TaxID=1314779 RepID=A0A6A6DEQ4_9PEZI|nr:hypothetical protein K469DRAFT_722287 [Zopfia rhizophila CBS 207.26]
MQVTVREDTRPGCAVHQVGGTLVPMTICMMAVSHYGVQNQGSQGLERAFSTAEVRLGANLSTWFDPRRQKSEVRSLSVGLSLNLGFGVDDLKFVFASPCSSYEARITRNGHLETRMIVRRTLTEKGWCIRQHSLAPGSWRRNPSFS